MIRDSIARQIAALRKNIPPLSDLADGEHPSPVYHAIITGIHARIRLRRQWQLGSGKHVGQRLIKPI